MFLGLQFTVGACKTRAAENQMQNHMTRAWQLRFTGQTKIGCKAYLAVLSGE